MYSYCVVVEYIHVYTLYMPHAYACTYVYMYVCIGHIMSAYLTYRLCAPFNILNLHVHVYTYVHVHGIHLYVIIAFIMI